MAALEVRIHYLDEVDQPEHSDGGQDVDLEVADDEKQVDEELEDVHAVPEEAVFAVEEHAEADEAEEHVDDEEPAEYLKSDHESTCRKT